MHASHFDTHMHAHTPTQCHSQEHLTHWSWRTVCEASLCTDKQKISSDRYLSCRLWRGHRWAFICKSTLTLPAYGGAAAPLWSSWWTLKTRQESINICGISHRSAVQRILCRDENRWLGDLSLQVMKYTFFREGHTAGPSEWGICNDKTMIYSGWSSRGRVGNTLTMIYYLLSAKMELCGSQRKNGRLLFSVSYWDESLLSDRQAQQQLANVFL